MPYDFYDKKKKKIEPNFSFDLCRLSCCFYDNIIENNNLDNNKNNIYNVITGWCNDDSGNNILYKMNGDERYPDFKLYKMIARKVNKHIPRDVINHKVFKKYIKSNIDKSNIIDIDKIIDFFKNEKN